ncbi:Acetoacetate decarboxylase (ADC) [Thermomonospora echinospora]|uniref:Acetoacetate decarboxylase (ADC) n=2 Tax=Thermomonospora echinospora TaxID=1992 RepID=A0A1H6E1T5_9ACTN|nr:Acetoacetate decarboxylase (ADC) [Thermomonospora echinospora]
MPVQIREASVASAMFPVPARTAQEIIGYSGLEVLRPLPGRAVCALAFVRYDDGDLGPYHEFAVTFLVRDPAPPPGRLKNVGVFVHWLPVDQSFTLEAGRSIWGFPKLMTDIPLDLDGRVKHCAVRVDGRPVVEMAVLPGLPVPGGGAPEIAAFSCLDGVTRRTPWTTRPTGVRLRPGGAAVRVGGPPDAHPIVEELRRLGLPRARALSSATVAHLSMTFHDAQRIG